MMTLQQFQHGLLKLGYKLGPAGADGIAGTITSAAVIKFKVEHGLSATAAIGPKTVAALEAALAKHYGKPAPTESAAPEGIEPMWVLEARRWMGVKEVVGRGSNPKLMAAAKDLGPAVLGMDYQDDDTPWCGMIMGFWIKTVLAEEPLPSIVVRAKSWTSFGIGLDKPSVGAVLVFGRTGGGHVGLYVGEDDTHYHVLGGNQSNMVSVMRIAKDRLLPGGIRWPRTVPAPRTGPLHLTAGGAPVSRNEG
ncbi:MAG: TIGR02594 family protein [Alphaproteobacteria bacterium]|nr:TIGR02594 family protein [Alphaproteobacteria bacterium]